MRPSVRAGRRGIGLLASRRLQRCGGEYLPKHPLRPPFEVSAATPIRFETGSARRLAGEVAVGLSCGCDAKVEVAVDYGARIFGPVFDVSGRTTTASIAQFSGDYSRRNKRPRNLHGVRQGQATDPGASNRVDMIVPVALLSRDRRA